MDKVEQAFSTIWNELCIFFQSMVMGKNITALVIFVLVIGIIIGSGLMLFNKKQEKENKVKDWLILTVIVIVLAYMIGIAVLGWDNKKIRDAEILLAMATVIAPIISFMGAYQLIRMEFKEKKQEDRKYALQMLYYLLNSCVEETDTLIEKIVDDYTKTFMRKPNKYLEKPEDICKSLKFILNKNINEIKCSTREESDEKDQLKRFKDRCSTGINAQGKHKGLVYDENWYNHIYYIDEEDRECVIKWLRILSTGITNDNIWNFIKFRDESINVIGKISKLEIPSIEEDTSKSIKSIYGYESKFKKIKLEILDGIHDEALKTPYGLENK